MPQTVKALVASIMDHDDDSAGNGNTTLAPAKPSTPSKRAVGNPSGAQKEHRPPPFRKGLRSPRPVPLEGTHPTLPIKNLVLEGGGVRGIAYAGAFQVLNDVGAMPYITRFGGASIGSIAALQAALGYTPDEINSDIASLNIYKTMNDGTLASCGEGFFSTLGLCWTTCKMCTCCGSCCCPCSTKPKGIHPGLNLRDYIGDIVEKKTGRRDTTFKELYDLTGVWNPEKGKYEGGVEFAAVVCNLSLACTEFWHVKTVPHKQIQDAVRTSAGVPLFFEPIVDKGMRGEPMTYGDGGVMCNYPVHMFDGWWLSMKDEDSFVNRLAKAEEQGIPLEKLMSRHCRHDMKNWETLGLALLADLDKSEMNYWRRLSCTRRVDADGKVTITNKRRSKEELDAMSGIGNSAEGVSLRFPDTKLARDFTRAQQRIQPQNVPITQAIAPKSDAIRKIRERMKKADTNKDGIITKKELKKMLHVNPKLADDLVVFSTEDVDAFHKAMDIDGDGKVSVEEALAWLDAEGPGALGRAFIRFYAGAHKNVASGTDILVQMLQCTQSGAACAVIDFEDIGRSVLVETSYVDFLDFHPEPKDIEYLNAQGQAAMKRFIRDMNGEQFSASS